MAYPKPSVHLEAIKPSLIRTMAACRDEHTLDLGLGEPDLPLPPELLEPALTQLKEGAHGIYTQRGLTGILRSAIMKHLGLPEEQWERVIVTCGSAGALSSVIGALLGPGEEVLTPGPSYPAYADLIRMFHGTNTVVPLADAGPQFVEGLKRAVTSKTKGLIINSPVNPTGQVFLRKR